MRKTNLILGVMSGTSLDGIDFALCRFFRNKEKFHYKTIKTDFIPYDSGLKKSLSEAHKLGTYEFLKLHKTYGSYIGKQINYFITDEEKPDYIASHGHTVFHKPEDNITFQIGDGAFIAAETGCSVVSDFRNLDTALNGQGAPLVPIGDKLLFNDYEYCINLGGFANVSYDNNKNERIAFDICPVNFILNRLAFRLGADYDKNGDYGKQGFINEDLLMCLNKVAYYSKAHPKSLGREYVEKHYDPVLNKFNITEKDKIRTFYKHIATQINTGTLSPEERKILLTGGGTHNKFLVSEIKKHTKHKVVIPHSQIIDFKEAIIFAFLGFLRISNINNTIKSVTGANSDSIGGSIYIFS